VIQKLITNSIQNAVISPFIGHLKATISECSFLVFTGRSFDIYSFNRASVYEL